MPVYNRDESYAMKTQFMTNLVCDNFCEIDPIVLSGDYMIWNTHAGDYHLTLNSVLEIPNYANTTIVNHGYTFDSSLTFSPLQQIVNLLDLDGLNKIEPNTMVKLSDLDRENAFEEYKVELL